MNSISEIVPPEDLYRKLFHEAPVAYFSVGINGKIYLANRSAVQLLGYPPEGLVGTPVLNLYADTPRGKEKAKKVFERFRAGEEITETELEMCKLTGEIINILLWVRPILDPNGDVIASRGIVIDITHHKQQENRRIQNLLNKIEDAVFIIDPAEDKIINVNTNASTLLGYTTEELLSLPVSIIHPDEMDKLRSFAEKARKQDKAWTDKLTCRSKHGEIIPSEMIASEIEIHNKTYMFILVRDIRHQIQTKEQYRKLLTAIEQSPVTVVMTDKDGNIEYVNPKFEQLTGYRSEEVIGKNPRILKSGRQSVEFYKDLWNTILAGKEWRGELHNRKKNGELYWEYATISPMTDNAGNIINFIAVKEDITQQKILEEQLKQAQKMEAIGQLAGGIAHDFNNVLGIIRGSIYVISEQTDDPRLKKFIAMIESGVERGASITGRLLTFARKGESQFENIDIAEIIRDVNRTLEHTIEKSIKINIGLPSSLPPVWGNRSDIYQTLINLCINARDAIVESEKKEGGAITIQTSVVKPEEIHEKFQPDIQDDYVKINITDTGKGIPEDTRHRMFEPYFTTKPIGKGTGLGLSIAYGIVKSHKGYIDFESEVEKGTRFSIFLPVSQIKETRAAIKPKTTDLQGEEPILLVDDEPELRELAVDILSRQGYRVHTAEDGLDAISLFSELYNDIELIILDLELPIVSGIQLLRKIRRKDSRIPVIVASGYINPSMKDELFELGVTTIVQKPYKSDELLASIRNALKQKNG